MAKYPVVVGYRTDALCNENLFDRFCKDPYWMDTQSGVMKPNVHKVFGDDFHSVMMTAMHYATLELDTPWFFYVDARYDVEGPIHLWEPETPNAMYVYKTKHTFGTPCHRDDQLGDPAGLFFLPSLLKATTAKFSCVDDAGNQATKPVADLAYGFTSWPYMVSDKPFASKILANSTFVLQFDEPDEKVSELLSAIHDKMWTNGTHLKTKESIFKSHTELARQSKSKMFYVLDADFVFDSAVADFPVDLWSAEEDYVNIWYARNPINGLVYGHGGPKLFNRDHFLQYKNRGGPDMTLGVGLGLLVRDVCVGTHAFNWSPFSTWRTAVREAAKLAKLHDAASRDRLKAWLTKADPNADYAEYCLAGAKKGVFLANQSVNMEWINNYAYLQEIFNKEFQNEESNVTR